MLAALRRWAQRRLAHGVRWFVGAHAQAVLVRTPHGVFAVAPEDQGVGRQLRLQGNWQPAELARLLGLLQPTDRALVVGAHVGALAIPLARRCVEVVAVEANPDTLELLEMNLALNRVANCRVLALAANDAPGTLRFLKSTTNSGGSKRLPLRADARYLHDRPQEIEVPAARLDDALVGERFDLVVMDIEGSEVFALRGMPSLLAHCRHLVVEFLPHHLSGVAGVTVPEFVAAVPSRFTQMLVPSTGERAGRAQFEAVLTRMARAGHADDGLVFSAA